MPAGGKRPGAGRPKGSGLGVRRGAAVAKAGGIAPLDYMLGVLNDPNQPDQVRMEAAKAAAPYCHARLQTIDQKTEIVSHNVIRSPGPAPTPDEWLQRVKDGAYGNPPNITKAEPDKAASKPLTPDQIVHTALKTIN